MARPAVAIRRIWVVLGGSDSAIRGTTWDLSGSMSNGTTTSHQTVKVSEINSVKSQSPAVYAPKWLAEEAFSSSIRVIGEGDLIKWPRSRGGHDICDVCCSMEW